MSTSERPTVVAPAALPPATAARGLAALAFGNASGAFGEAKHLAFLPLESLELDLTDPEQRDFGDYELLEQLGQGGMGVVYRAQQKSLDREVALKLLAAGPWASPDFIARFQREAQSAARLQHPNIVPIYEIGMHAELNFFSMALVRGKSLAQRLDARGAFPPREAARLVRTIAEALDYAHRLGILHLDLKPANVMLDESDEPQVADFGLARRLDETLNHDLEEVSGTPSYMAPEQATVKSHRLSAATDIYGLGAVLYELLCRRPPFLGDNVRETLRQVVGVEAASPRNHDLAIPEDLAAICLKCLEKQPNQRYLTARGMAEDLGRFLEGRPVSVRPLSQWQRIGRWARREPRVAISAAAAVVALVLGLLATTLQWQRAEEQSERAEQGAARVREVLWDKRSADTASLLRQHKTLDALPDLVQNLAEQEAAGAAAQAELSRLRIGTLLAHAPVLVDSIALQERISNVLLDPAGQWVAVVTNASVIRRIDLPTGELRWSLSLEAFNHPVRLTLSSSGRQLIAESMNPGFLLARGLDTHLIDLESGALLDPPVDKFPGRYSIHFSRDASFAVAVTHSAAHGGSTRGRLVRVADWQVLGQEHTLDGPSLLGPGGRWLANHAGSLRQSADGAGKVRMFEPRSMQRLWEYQPPGASPLRAWRVGPGDHTLTLGFADGRVGLFDALSGDQKWLPSLLATEIDDLFFSDDGSWIAASHRDGSVQVWDVASATAVVLPLSLALDRSAVVGEIHLDPGGRRLFTSERDGARLWLLPGPQKPAELIFDRPGYVRGVGNLANAGVITQGLYASGSYDGELRIWRLRSPVPLPARAPLRQMRDLQRRVDSSQSLHVDGTRVQLRGLGATPDGALLEFSQAVGFAQMLPGTRQVLATVGHELHLRDAFDGVAARAPLPLPATPSALLVTPDGRKAVVAWQDYLDARSWLVLRSIDLNTGGVLAETRLDHPVWQLQMADDGSAIIAWRHGPLTLLDIDDLRPRWPPRGFAQVDEFTPVRSARLGADGRTLWVSSGIGTGDGYRLHALNALDGVEQDVWRMPAWALALQPFDQGRSLAALLPGQEELRLYQRGGPVRAIKLVDLDEWGYPGIALSADERRLVVGLKRGVQWLDPATGDWLSPPLQLSAEDIEFAGVGIDAAGTAALMQDSERRQWRFELVREQRPVAELQELAGLLVPAEYALEDAFAAPRDAGLRGRLRAADPGAPAPAAIAAAATAREAVPVRRNPRFVDLSSQCNFHLEGFPHDLHLEPRLDRTLTPGHHRLLGIDFDVRCGILARYAPAAPAKVELGSRVEGIALEVSELAALELLMLAPTLLQSRQPETYAVVEIQYRDGSRERMPLTYGRELQAWFNPDYNGELAEMRVAYVALGAQFSEFGAAPAMVPTMFAVRVVNPHPERAVASLALESTRHAWSSPLLLAATLEAVGPDPLLSATPEASHDQPLR